MRNRIVQTSDLEVWKRMAQTSDLFNFYLLFLFHKYPKTKMWTTIKENVWIWFPTKSASGIFFQIFQKFRKINKSHFTAVYRSWEQEQLMQIMWLHLWI